MSQRNFLPLLATATLIGATPDQVSWADPPGAMAKWQVGDMWEISITLPSQTDADSASEPKRDLVAWYVVLVGMEKVDNADCWKLVFAPTKSNPSTPRPSQWYAFVDKQTGWLRKLLREKKAGTAEQVPLRAIGQVRIPLSIDESVPLELFPTDEPVVLHDEKSSASVTVSKRENGDGTVVELSVKSPNQPHTLIRQTWLPGENWWRSYERIIGDKTEFSARLVKIRKPPLSRPGADPPGTDAFYLRRDLRLHAAVSFDGKAITLADALQRLRGATGLEFSIGPDLHGHKPVFDGQLKSAPAWSVMELIAAIKLDNGRWVKMENGYQLEGVITGHKARNEAPARDAVASIRFPTVIISLVLIVGLSAWIVIRRWKSR